jgi:hypothetical protein
MCQPGVSTSQSSASAVAASSPSPASNKNNNNSWSSWLVNIWNVVVSKYQTGQLSWILVIYLTFVHIVAIVGIFAIPYCQPKTLIFAFILWPITYVIPVLLSLCWGRCGWGCWLAGVLLLTALVDRSIDVLRGVVWCAILLG